MGTPCGGRGGNRRQFLQIGAATGATIAAVPSFSRADEPFPTTTLGKTGQTVSRLGMGTSWAVAPSFVQAALAAGVRYIDTAEGYERGKSEKTIGEVLERTGKRKDVFLVTKASFRNANQVKAVGAAKYFEDKLNASLERLRTDHVDAYYIWALTARDVAILKDPEVIATFERLKKAGKIRHAGISSHDSGLVRVVEAAAECGWLDQIMIQFNFRTMNGDDIRRAVDKASAARLGLVAMKTQGGGGDFAEGDAAKDYHKFIEGGFKKEQAAIKAVFADQRINVVVSEMVNRDQLKDNMAATVDPLSPKHARLLEEHRQQTAHMYCHGCGQLCETAAKGVPVATVMRYLRYYSVYGKRSEARELYQALPAEARNLAAADLAAAEKACPHGLPVVDLIGRADRLMS